LGVSADEKIGQRHLGRVFPAFRLPARDILTIRRAAHVGATGGNLHNRNAKGHDLPGNQSLIHARLGAKLRQGGGIDARARAALARRIRNGFHRPSMKRRIGVAGVNNDIGVK